MLYPMSCRSLVAMLANPTLFFMYAGPPFAIHGFDGKDVDLSVVASNILGHYQVLLYIESQEALNKASALSQLCYTHVNESHYTLC